MFEIFKKKFASTDKEKGNGEEIPKMLPVSLFALFSEYGGKSFDNGLYRVHSFSSSIRWSLIIPRYFTKYQNRLYPFGFDWMGRQFCMDTKNSNRLYMFDPATGEDFELQRELEMLHDEDFVNDTDDMLANNLFKKTLQYYNLKSVNYNECLGYKIPLFMGGGDNVENYERLDMEVYWELQNQLYKKAHALSDGTKIKSVKISDSNKDDNPSK